MAFVPALLTLVLLSVVEWKVKMPMLLVERFFPGWGWVEVILLSGYAAFLFVKLHDVRTSALWRRRSWTLFAVFFFAQLVAGLLGCDECLMTGKLHFPIPALILGGAVYRLKIGFMPILFLSTVILSGPAWCSQLCYFGAFDNLAAYSRKIGNKRLVNRNAIRNSFFVLFLTVIVLLRIFDAPLGYAVAGASVIGVVGVLIVIFISPQKGKMVHCVSWCPIGTLIRYIKYVNPFRMTINNGCTECMLCTVKCPYDALNREDIINRKPGPTCTYCGDCLSSCPGSHIEYRFMKLSPERSRNLWLIITITLHAVFMGLARM